MPTILRPWRRPARLFTTIGFDLTALPVAVFGFAEQAGTQGIGGLRAAGRVELFKVHETGPRM